MTRKARGTPAVIVTQKWKISELCGTVRRDVENGWTTPGQARQIIKSGKAQMVYTPPSGRKRGKP